VSKNNTGMAALRAGLPVKLWQKNDFQYAGLNSYSLQCGTITKLISSGNCTLHCGMWLWNRDSEFTKWQHPAMWNVAVGWHAIEFAQTSTILEIYIWFPYPHITTVDMSFCTSLRNFIRIRAPSAEKMTSCRWQISAILDFRGPIMGSLKSPCTTCYRSSIMTIALNCLVFEKIAFLHFGDRQIDRQPNRQTNRWTAPMH